MLNLPFVPWYFAHLFTYSLERMVTYTLLYNIVLSLPVYPFLNTFQFL